MIATIFLMLDRYYVIQNFSLLSVELSIEEEGEKKETEEKSANMLRSLIAANKFRYFNTGKLMLR